ncbi:hypothetical protein FGIG_01605 [Fasciola gigantica]|uniref:DUF7041 domain-containing protein n=1 Tax=Fasciola gigantica TaxID=46835 RepID=A0A504YMW3_FASGI|nr:hypothetical protein FGIG_01605 [Fasciola gigantica]
MAQDTKPEIPKLESVEKRLPVFWHKDPGVWFVIAENHFCQWNVTKSDTKFSYVVTALPETIAHRARDLIMQPHPVEPYEQFKSALLRRLGDSDHKRFDQLPFSEEHGNHRTSQLLRHLEQVFAEKKLAQSMFRELILERLSPDVRSILSPRRTLSLDELAALAEDLSEITDASRVSTMSSNPTEETSRALCKQIEILNKLDSSSSVNDELDWVECFKLYLLDTFMDKVC